MSHVGDDRAGAAPVADGAGRAATADAMAAAGVSGRAQDEGYLASLKSLAGQALGLLREFRALLGAEARLFVSSVGLIVALIVVAGFLVGAAWLFLGGAVALLLVRQVAFDPVLALLLVGGVSLLLLLGVGLWIRALVRNLSFAHSRRALAGLLTPAGGSGPAGEPGEERAR